MSENNIYEIAKQMSDPENLNTEIKEAVTIFSNHIKKKYIEPIGSAIENHRQECLTKPSNEVILLQACRPFIKGDGLDKAIDIFNSISLIQSIKSEIAIQSINDSSIHPDGIYDIDESCLVKANGGNSLTDNSSIIFAVIAVLLILGK